MKATGQKGKTKYGYLNIVYSITMLIIWMWSVVGVASFIYWTPPDPMFIRACIAIPLFAGTIAGAFMWANEDLT